MARALKAWLEMGTVTALLVAFALGIPMLMHVILAPLSAPSDAATVAPSPFAPPIGGGGF